MKSKPNGKAAMSAKPKKPYEIGYGKPPKATRFKPGESGNSKGRPKGSKNLATLLEEELSATVPVTENGKRKMISKLRVAVKQLVNKCAGGDLKAFGVMSAMLTERETGKAGADAAEIFKADQDVIEEVVDRIRRLGSNPQREPDDESAGQSDNDTSGEEKC
jgi:hypothetical protein